MDPLIEITYSPEWKDYEMLDSGGGWKLERFGIYTFVRPEVQAVWSRKLPQTMWDSADAHFQPTGEEMGGHFSYRRTLHDRWQMEYKDLKFWAQTGASRHLGVFPEQAAQWDWISTRVKEIQSAKVLNLFGYTGLATLAASDAGGQITHVDASKKSVAWARDNQLLSGLQDRPVRWIVDDAAKFLQREVRRGSQYNGIIIDPPKFGRGPKGEVWEFFKDIQGLLSDCKAVLSRQHSFFLITAYAVKCSAITLYEAISDTFGKQGEISCGELVTRDTSGGRTISNAIYCRLSRD
jgi:23S rRNA (cytosine1962-C5)-methyltransferase